ncbi:uncharacterized protein BO80DRAFT_429676 [Aspergillus ibericus CBS 121593]|uniref:Uncharacterized protein n=1 Tax=Aspergillus ibericus CBS 121593 TaxID=1448316 RepID=A0A395GLN7_9EURO|nr:hypothetical protein BO80DRAFT_429676 [Aspergillus ibericus CBS 121593]RAK95737.1 hypothetical protein BO80DRAFT_429676 [Aspergillus ibericus CBS 121593]
MGLGRKPPGGSTPVNAAGSLQLLIGIQPTIAGLESARIFTQRCTWPVLLSLAALMAAAQPPPGLGLHGGILVAGGWCR